MVKDIKRYNTDATSASVVSSFDGNERTGLKRVKREARNVMKKKPPVGRPKVRLDRRIFALGRPKFEML